MRTERITEATVTVVLVVFVFMLDACSRSELKNADLANQFEEAININKEIVFIDSSNLGASRDGAILSLHFFAGFKVHLYTSGNGFSDYAGTYAFTDNNGIELSFTAQSWPRLRILKKGNLFTLERQDGLKSLKKSYIHTDQNGIRRQVDDGDIYPEAQLLIFPLTQRIATAEQDAADQAPTDAESKSRASPNHALQRTGAAVTAPASTATFPPAMHGPRQPRPSLSLGSLGVATPL